MAEEIPAICSIRHPEYDENVSEWEKYRLAYSGGTRFREAFLQKFSSRESKEDFELRKKITYIPAFAKSAVNEIKNSIFQRIVSIVRTRGTDTYQKSIDGLLSGVDRRGSTMNSFIGREILPELLPIGKVGIFVDRTPTTGLPILSNQGRAPYLYKYRAEDILSWTLRPDSESDFTSVLLRDHVEITNGLYGLVSSCVQRLRHICIADDGLVHIKFYLMDGTQVDANNVPTTEDIILKLKKIPFVVFQLTQGLMTDVADYQISLLNLASSDMAYAVKSNFPFYVEQADIRDFLMGSLPGASSNQGTAGEALAAKNQEVDIGGVSGRRYAKGSDAPKFINPSSEPLQISMDKQEQLKNEIRLLVHLSLSNVQSKSASAESKSLDMSGLESGLSYIGLELEHGERRIAEHWAAYEGEQISPTIRYPERYDLKSDDERRKDATAYQQLLPAIPSKTYRQQLSKKIAKILIGAETPNDLMAQIDSEIDNAPAIVAMPDQINKDVQDGVLSKQTAADIRGYPEGEAEQAAAEHAQRVLTLAQAQSTKQGNPAARGLVDLSPDPAADAVAEKTQSQDSTMKDSTKKLTRGNAQ